jgi:CRP-like cAMP-binding protein
MQSSPQNAIDAGERAAVASPGSRPKAEPRSYRGRWSEEDRAFDEAKAERAPIGHFHRTPRQNRLLAALDATDYGRLEQHLDFVEFPLGSVVCEARSTLDYVHFPTSGIVSHLYELEDGTAAELAVTGNEGLVGVAAFMGGTTTSRAVVRSAGSGYRLSAETMRKEFETTPMLRQLLLRYSQALITQMAQTAVCHCHHQLEQQLCRLLLQSLDRQTSNELTLTHEMVGNLLGVRRESVTAVAGKLQAAQLIRYHRGRVAVLNRAELETRVCECYKAVKVELDRLLPRASLAGSDATTQVVISRQFIGDANAPSRPQRNPVHRGAYPKGVTARAA